MRRGKLFSLVFFLAALCAISARAQDDDSDVKVEEEEDNDDDIFDELDAEDEPDAEASFYGADSAVDQLDMEQLAAITETSTMYFVEFYAPWCAHCKALAPEFEKAAEKLADYRIKFGAVDCDEHKEAQAAHGVQGFPTIHVYTEPPSINPYTKKPYRPHLNYQGARTFKAIKTFAAEHMPNRAVVVDEAGLEELQEKELARELPVALVLSSKARISPLVKVLSSDFAGRLSFAQAAQDAGGEQLADTFGVHEFPAIVVLLPNGQGHEVYKGNLKRDEIATFLDKHARTDPLADDENDAGNGKGGGGSGASSGSDSSVGSVKIEKYGDTSALKINREVFDKAVSASEMAHILLHVESASALDADAKLLAQVKSTANKAVKMGSVSVGVVDCAADDAADLCDDGMSLPLVRVYKYGKPDTAAGKLKRPTKEASLKAALRTAAGSVPDRTFVIQEGGVQQALTQTYQQEKLAIFLYANKAKAPALLKTVANAYEEHVSIFIVPNPSDAAKKQYNVPDKLPFLTVMIADTSGMGAAAAGEAVELNFQMAPYAARQMGGFNLRGIMAWTGSVVQQVAPKIIKRRENPDGAAGAEGEEGAEGSSGEGAANAAAFGAKGEFTEVMPSNFDTLCTRLCVVALVNGREEESDLNKEAVQMLRDMHGKDRYAPFQFMWLDARCHRGFASAMHIDGSSLPTVAVISPKKLRYSSFVGSFNADSVGGFIQGVLSGSRSTSALKNKEMPPLKESNDLARCEAIAAEEAAAIAAAKAGGGGEGGDEGGGDAGAEEDEEDMEAFLAEIRAEEAAKEAEDAAEKRRLYLEEKAEKEAKKLAESKARRKQKLLDEIMAERKAKKKKKKKKKKGKKKKKKKKVNKEAEL